MAVLLQVMEGQEKQIEQLKLQLAQATASSKGKWELGKLFS